jgi:hypothetical protein
MHRWRRQDCPKRIISPCLECDFIANLTVPSRLLFIYLFLQLVISYTETAAYTLALSCFCFILHLYVVCHVMSIPRHVCALLCDFMRQNVSWKVNGCSDFVLSSVFIEIDTSFSCSHEPMTGSCSVLQKLRYVTFSSPGEPVFLSEISRA